MITELINDIQWYVVVVITVIIVLLPSSQPQRSAAGIVFSTVCGYVFVTVCLLTQ